ncbi:unnamed protein product [Calicophoron daubneyi]|uniref:Vacuolar protein sorting-associated protein 72 homolog n=1 Tax=Calicophoron daubneyi TaxID=300641 RepID=A0AAV2U0L9_CALDB
MPLCVDRERRPNAGSRMAKLLNEEEEDEFYTKVYGGFSEEADDLDYESESSVEDSVDSDFDVDGEAEDDKDESDDDDGDEEGKSRKRPRSSRVVTKAYTEPKRAKTTDGKATAPKTTQSTVPSTGTKTKSDESSASLQADATSEPRTFRRSTLRATAQSEAARRKAATTQDTAVRRKAMLAEIAQRKNVPEVRRLTQEELLAEAKLTEEINRRSLARYQRLEVEKKKARIQKTVHSAPMIRYHSFTVPNIDEQPDLYGVSVDRDTSTIRAGPIIENPSARCTRNLITFADLSCLQASLPRTATPLPEPGKPAPVPPRPRRHVRICPISGLPARYVDPVTLTPYANLAAFRVLRRLYAIHLETNTPAIDLLREYRNG